jgi:GT2 family glycosyltransferase
MTDGLLCRVGDSDTRHGDDAERTPAGTTLDAADDDAASDDSPPEQPVLPQVVAVVVAHDPGDWFTATLEALAQQDYPGLRVVVMDSGSSPALAEEIRHTVSRSIPDAVVHRVGKNVGFGGAANEVLSGGVAHADAADADFFLFCHDDVAPEPTTVHVLVETALAWGASVVGPKLVGWDDPRWVLQMGEAVDKTATVVPLIESYELDQGQHDGLREVFAVPGAVTLVRAKTFARIGGFDEAIKLEGDNLSLCWRARIGGARVLVTSATRVRHRQALPERVPDGLRRRHGARARLRLLLTCYGPAHLWRVLPQAALLSWFRIVTALATARFSSVRAMAGAWLWNIWRLPSVWIARSQVRRFRRAPDAALRQLQVPGLTRSQRIIRRRAATAASPDAGPPPVSGVTLPGPDVAAAAAHGQPGERFARGDRTRGEWTPGSVVIIGALACVLVMGSRHLLTRGVPLVGDLVAFDAPGRLFDEWTSGWRRTGLGSDDPAPSVLAALSTLGTFLDGHMALLRTALTVGLIPVGVIGAFRLLRPSGSPRAPVGAAVAYAALPVPYAALAAGRWAPLAAYAAMPWLLSRLAKGSGLPPYEPSSGEQPTGSPGIAVHALVLGVMTALFAMLVPAAPAVVLLLAGALAIGSLLAFEVAGALRVAAVAVGGVLVAGVLHLPWSLAAVGWGEPGDRSPLWWGLDTTGGGIRPLDLLGLSTAAPAAHLHAAALMAAAGLALIVGRAWRLTWAIRGWVIALAAFGLVWVHQHDVIGVPLPHLDVLMTMAGAGLAMAIGYGVGAVELDVAGRSWRFGFRRMVVALAGAALVVAVFPLVEGSVDGYWDMPRGDFASLLDTVDEDVADTPARVLWLGHPDVLPVHGWPLGSGDDRRDTRDVAYATTLQGQPTVQDLWPPPAGGPMERIADAIDLARAQETTRLGSLLAPMAVQYIAVPQQLAPSAFTSEAHPPAGDLLGGLAEQLDLQRVPADSGFVLYRNLAFLPARGVVPLPEDPEAAATDEVSGRDPSGLAQEPLPPAGATAGSSQVQPALEESVAFAYDRGELPAGVAVIHSVVASDRWVLSVDGAPVERGTAFGWANQFAVTQPGTAELRYETPAERYVVLAIQGAAWIVALFALVVVRRRSTKRRWATTVEEMAPRPVPQWVDMSEDGLVRIIEPPSSHDAAATARARDEVSTDSAPSEAAAPADMPAGEGPPDQVVSEEVVSEEEAPSEEAPVDLQSSGEGSGDEESSDDLATSQGADGAQADSNVGSAR